MLEHNNEPRDEIDMDDASIGKKNTKFTIVLLLNIYA